MRDKELPRSIILKYVIFLFLLPSTAFAQSITKKESAAIDQIIADVSAKHKPATYVVRDVTVITMRANEVLEHRDVRVKNGVITAVGERLDATDAIEIDGKSKYLMPGLTDMHVHLFDKHALRNTWMLALLLHGVTTVRDMCGEPAKLVLREKIRSNELLAPNLYQAGPIINGVKDNMGLFALATTPEQGRAIVQSQKQAGYDFVKVYDHLQTDVYASIADEAQKQQMLVAGHVPDAVALTDAATHHQSIIEHLTGYFEWKESQVTLTAPADYATMTASAGLWNCPTLYKPLNERLKKGCRRYVCVRQCVGTRADEHIEAVGEAHQQQF
ncbi:MAG: amidohydrolase family protein [Bacteroidia bacterium]|nr:amidohydrolase family protein [Bacteroidia bacterium]